eukprot:1143070-Pelagomonas_calceolata.AAC.1
MELLLLNGSLAGALRYLQPNQSYLENKGNMSFALNTASQLLGSASEVRMARKEEIYAAVPANHDN